MVDFIKEYPGLFYMDAVWIGFVSIAGVIGNSLALCAVATTPSLRTLTQLHITILAGIDLFITGVLAPCRIATEYYSGRWPRHQPWCHFLAYVVIFVTGYSLQQLMYLSQNRFLRVTRSAAFFRKIVKPLIIIQQGCAVTITSMLTLLPLYSGFGSVGYHTKSHFCFTTGRNQQVLAAICMVMALVVTPTFYGLTFMHVRAHRRKVQNWQGLRLESTGNLNNGSTHTAIYGNAATVHQNKGIRQLQTNGQIHGKIDASKGMVSYQIPDVESANLRTAIGSNSAYGKPNTSTSVNSTAPAAEVAVNPPVPVPKNAARVRPKNGPTQESMKITRNLLLIFCAYICCWLPWCILSLIEPHVDVPVPVYHVINNIIWTNSCINPYLYASMSRIYRNAFKRCCRLKCLRKR
ncbi:G-protein coupled receptor 84-like [Patiria miniata]|uniref:G-protein coupled receptors family 1 profile domain-containing protein n=1 Tax=Patiria miniata TaxID=46514 RepID=A0A914B8U9_PATMI|nr:G-protein coupled receptor 84-like [Patiria miniata]